MTRAFFTNLPIHRAGLSRLLDDEKHFVEVPEDWYVIVTDIRNSTKAFKAGRSEEINLVATGCIIATLNLAQQYNLEVPFFFGGDGATLLVPPELLKPALSALHVHRGNAKSIWGFDLRVGAVSVFHLKGMSHGLKICRVALSAVFSIPVVLGNGLSAAEHIIKEKDQQDIEESATENKLDLSGMECRWDKIKPATSAHEVVCLLVSAREPHKQSQVFKRVVDLVDAIYGPYALRNPVTRSRLRINCRLGKIVREMRARLGGFDLIYLARHWLLTLFGKFFYFRREAGAYYMEKLVELTDTLVIDGRINTVIAGTASQRTRLETELNRLEDAGMIAYGLFVSRESIMSCYVRDRKDKHIHFVDGSDGGYTMAAAMWKMKTS